MSVTTNKWFGFPRTRPFIRPYPMSPSRSSYLVRKVVVYALYMPMAYNVELKWELFTVTMHNTWDKAYKAAQFLAELRVHENAMPCIAYPDQFHPSGLMCDCERP